MPGGSLQLNIKGIEDKELIINPQISFFKYVSNVINKYTRVPLIFTLETDNNKLNSYLNHEYVFTIPKGVSLIKEIFIKINFPRLIGSKLIYHDIKWTNDLGFKIFKMLKIRLGRNLIHSFSGEYLYLYYNLILSKNKMNILKDMLSESIYKNTPVTYQYDSNSTDSKYSSDYIFCESFNIILPIPTWFSKEAFPLKGLIYEDINLTLELQSLSTLIEYRLNETINIDNNIILKSPYQPVSTSILDSILESNYEILPEIIINYIYLDDKVYNSMYSNTMYFYIECVNLLKEKDIKTNFLNYEYETFGTTKDLIIIAARDDSTLRNDTLNFTNKESLSQLNLNLYQNFILHTCIEQLNNDLIINNNALLTDYLKHFIINDDNEARLLDMNIFTLLYDDIKNIKIESNLDNEDNEVNLNTQEFEKSNEIKIFINKDNSINSEYISLIREHWFHREINDIPIINNNNKNKYKNNIIESIEIKYNNMIREDKKNYFYYNHKTKYNKYNGFHKNDIYTYSFSMEPIKEQFSGHCNFSHINKVNILFNFNLIDNVSYEVSIYNRYYNMIELKNGVTNLIFFK